MNYLSRLSGPMMDRIDIHLSVPNISAAELKRLKSAVTPEPSSVVAARVKAARVLQQRRFIGENINSNAEMGNKHIERFCLLDEECNALLMSIMERMGFSMRAYFRIIKVARTIADLAASENILPVHISEAASFRYLDRVGTVRF